MRVLGSSLLLLLVFCWPLLTGQVIGFDPLYYNCRFPLSQHELCWNPCAYGGIPVLGDVQNATLYPFTLPYYLLDPQIATGLSLSFHLFLAWAGTWFLGRTLGLSSQASALAALAFSLGFWPVFHLAIVSMNSVLAWFPWILGAALRFLGSGRARWWAALVVFCALQWLAGHPQPTVYCGLCVVVLGFFHRRRFLGLIAALVCGLLLSGVQTWPGALVASRGMRSHGLSAALQGSYSLTPRMLVTAVSPFAYGGETVTGTPGFLWRWLGSPQGPYTGDWNIEEVCVYPGLATWLLVLLALRSRRAAWLMASVGVCLVVAMGLVPLGSLPGGAMLRTPARFTLPACLALALLAGMGLRAARPRVVGLATVVLSCLHLAAPAPLGWVNHLPLLFLILAAVALCFRRWSMVTLLVGLDLLITAQGYVTTFPYPYRDPRVPNAALERMAQVAGTSRVLLGTSPAVPGTIVNWATPLGLRSLQGWNPMAPSAPVLALYFNEAGRFPETQEEFDRLSVGNFLFAVSRPATPLMELLGVRFILDGRLKVLENPRALPWAWVPTSCVVEASTAAGLGRVQSKEWDPRVVAFSASPVVAGEGTLELGEGRFTAAMSRPGLVATNLFSDPSWRVSVDGAPAAPVEVYGLLLGVVVPAGRHDVVWRYVPDGLAAGAGLSLLGLLGLVLGACAYQQREKKRGADQPVVVDEGPLPEEEERQ